MDIRNSLLVLQSSSSPMAIPSYKHDQHVEICVKEQGKVLTFSPAIILAAIGKNRYIVQYKAKCNPTKTWFLTDVIDCRDLRPSPLKELTPVENFTVLDRARVDVYIDHEWHVGQMVRKDDPFCYVRMESDGQEACCELLHVRAHFDWEDGNWVSSPPLEDEAHSSDSEKTE